MPKNTFDPRLALPPVIDAEYDDRDKERIQGYGSDMPEFLVPPNQSLRPPENIRILEQIVRQGVGGKDIVDLIIEVEDVPGATQYEVRVTAQ